MPAASSNPTPPPDHGAYVTKTMRCILPVAFPISPTPSGGHAPWRGFRFPDRMDDATALFVSTLMAGGLLLALACALGAVGHQVLAMVG